MILIIGCVMVLSLTQPAFAYLDPGSGSMLTSALLGMVATLLFFVKGFYYKVRSWLSRDSGTLIRGSQEKPQLAFYSEGRQYWNTFKPILDELSKRGEPCVYLTSDKNDPGLLCANDVVRTSFIGTGRQAHTYLNHLEADVCVMTTPGLDVLQLKRSKGVKHYAHVMHSLTDAAIYKTYSFDYYDSILTSGDHQVHSIRKLEELRGTHPKQLLNTGCLYFDEMKRQLPTIDQAETNKDHITVLVAPTWGANGLLRKFGSRILLPLLEQYEQVILRPHPQSYISEKEMLESLQKELAAYPNLLWNNDQDGVSVMAKANVLVSDLSGIVFDFAFLFEKPVVTIKADLNRLGLEAADLPWDPWELTVLDVIGYQIGEEDIDRLPAILDSVVKEKQKIVDIRQLREDCAVNFGCAAESVADQLLHIRQTVTSNHN